MLLGTVMLSMVLMMLQAISGNPVMLMSAMADSSVASMLMLLLPSTHTLSAVGVPLTSLTLLNPAHIILENAGSQKLLELQHYLLQLLLFLSQ